MRVALTQSEGRLVGLAEALVAKGYQVVRNPLIRVEPILSDTARVQAAALLTCPWLLFTSSAAVLAWRALSLPLQGTRAHLGAVGARTAQLIADAAGKVALIAKPATAEGLAQAFLESPLAASPVGLPRGDRALPTLPTRLEKRGFATRQAVVYRTRLLPWRAGNVQAVILASPSAVEALPDQVGAKAALIAVGPTTAEAIHKRGWRCMQAIQPDIAAILTTLETLER